jgi:SAM-dependent methyltransferase
MNKIAEMMKQHYENTFKTHGATPKGVDWGESEENLNLRYGKMLAILNSPHFEGTTLLDIGCGFGGLLRFARSEGIDIHYTGIDVAENMICWAKNHFPKEEFLCGDILEMNLAKTFDYIVCNGILTQKLDTLGLDMDVFAQRLVRRMFDICDKGIVFNTMTTKVNYFSNNLYYRNPAELLAWCLSEISPYVRVDHAYPLYEYSIYIYKVPGDFRKDSQK